MQGTPRDFLNTSLKKILPIFQDILRYSKSHNLTYPKKKYVQRKQLINYKFLECFQMLNKNILTPYKKDFYYLYKILRYSKELKV